jgi:hypothetical protein
MDQTATVRGLLEEDEEFNDAERQRLRLLQSTRSETVWSAVPSLTAGTMDAAGAN